MTTQLYNPWIKIHFNTCIIFWYLLWCLQHFHNSFQWISCCRELAGCRNQNARSSCKRDLKLIIWFWKQAKSGRHDWESCESWHQKQAANIKLSVSKQMYSVMLIWKLPSSIWKVTSSVTALKLIGRRTSVCALQRIKLRVQQLQKIKRARKISKNTSYCIIFHLIRQSCQGENGQKESRTGYIIAAICIYVIWCIVFHVISRTKWSSVDVRWRDSIPRTVWYIFTSFWSCGEWLQSKPN